MSKISRKTRDRQFKSFGDHQKFLQRITKSLYYGKLPSSECLSLPVTEMASDIFSEVKSGKSLERLHSNDAAKISRNACVSPCSLVLAVLYLERLKVSNPEYLKRVAPSELFLVSLMLSSKFLHDDGEEDEVFMDEWASSGGISIKYLIQLEKEFLEAMQWEVFVSEHSFWKKLIELETILAKKQGLKRGWFTYTELNNLLTAIDIYNLIQYVLSLITILMATYAAGIFTLLGSVFIVSNIPGNCLQGKVAEPSANKSYLPVQNEEVEIFDDVSANEILATLESNKDQFESALPKFATKHLNAADVLKTGIILASIKSAEPNTRLLNKSSSNESPTLTENSNNVENICWDWWSSSVMDWLTKTSKLIENFDFMPNVRFTYHHYVDMSIANIKKIDLEDQVHKGTKLRRQDHLEASWHEEWTDMFKNIFYYPKPLFYYFQNIKS